MIAPMKKVLVFTLATEKADTLKKLRELGVIHLNHLRMPEGEELETLKKEMSTLESIRTVLSGFTPTEKAAKEAATAEVVLMQAQEQLKRKESLQEELSQWTAELVRLAPYGNLDPADMDALKDSGVPFGLYRCKTAEKEQVLGAINSEASWWQEFGEQGADTFLAAVISVDAVESINGLEPVEAPKVSLAQMRQRSADIQKEIAETDSALEALAAHKDVLAELDEALKSRLEWEEAASGMFADEKIEVLQGFAPAEDSAALQQAAKANGWGLELSEPAADEMVPTLLKQPPWVKPINTLFDMIGVIPGYREIDISAVFLLFFSFFFAMIVGDAGYGVIFLGMTVFFSRKIKSAPRQLFVFLGIMSVTTIIWGILTSNWFGLDFELLPGFLQATRIPWLANEENLQNLCFLIGSVHLSIAHLWNMWLKRKSLQILGQFGWLLTTWTMFFLANQMVLGKEFPTVMWKVFVAGVALIFLFNIPFSKLKEQWVDMVMLPLNLVTNFVDVVSYIRLFAVGAASFAVANSFNEMLAPMLGSAVTGILGAIFLFMAHGLNITLALMGVLVHGVRLNTLEYSNHMGLEWSGMPYQPFAETKKR